MSQNYWKIARVKEEPLLVTPNVGKQAFQAWTEGDEIIVIGNKSFARTSITAIEETTEIIPDLNQIASGLFPDGKRAPVMNEAGDAVLWAWYKTVNSVSAKQYNDYYSKTNGYFALEKAGDGVVLAFRKVTEKNVIQSQDITPCSVEEQVRLEGMYNQRNGINNG